MIEFFVGAMVMFLFLLCCAGAYSMGKEEACRRPVVCEVDPSAAKPATEKK